MSFIEWYHAVQIHRTASCFGGSAEGEYPLYQVRSVPCRTNDLLEVCVIRRTTSFLFSSKRAAYPRIPVRKFVKIVCAFLQRACLRLPSSARAAVEFSVSWFRGISGKSSSAGSPMLVYSSVPQTVRRKVSPFFFSPLSSWCDGCFKLGDTLAAKSWQGLCLRMHKFFQRAATISSGY